VSLGEHVLFTQQDEGPGQVTLEASVDGLVCARATLRNRPQPAPAEAGALKSELNVSSELHHLDRLVKSLDVPPESHQGKRYVLDLDTLDLSRHFPAMHARLGNDGLASTLALSYIVGMVCPGLHSVFSSLDVELRPEAASGRLEFSVVKYDPRFRLFDIAFDGTLKGGIKAFLRPSAQSQPSVQDLSAHVTAGEFEGTRALVIGGSRGLGEVTAKILAAGGGNVTITYAAGLEDAKAIAADINASSPESCQILQMDLSAGAFESAGVDWNALDAIYFFATPRIFRKKLGMFDARLFQEFCDFYITRFHDLCVFLETTLVGKKIRVYFPSTVFVEERPKGMTEYAMAKSAAEVLIQDINRTFKKVTVVSTRLPRLSTDQTTSIVKVSTGSNVESLLPVIRAVLPRQAP